MLFKLTIMKGWRLELNVNLGTVFFLFAVQPWSGGFALIFTTYWTLIKLKKTWLNIGLSLCVSWGEMEQVK